MKLKDSLIIIAVSILMIITWIPVKVQGMEIIDIDYIEYLNSIEDTARPGYEVIVPAWDYVDTDMESLRVIDDLAGIKALATGETGYVEWEVEIPQNGFYNIEIQYFPLEGRGGDIERALMINGRIPFDGAKFLEFARVWTDEYDYRIDNQGNHIRAPQKEVFIWQTKLLEDSMGYSSEPYRFYFEKGLNRVRLVSRREPMALAYLKFFKYDNPLPYAEVIKEYREKGYKEVEGFIYKVQAEDAVYRSSKTLYPVYDKADPTVEPYHPAQIRLNTIGGQSWNKAGQWIAWKVNVPEAGLYKIGIKAKQNIRSGSFTVRKLYINGQVPFKEAEEIRFNYSNYYRMLVPGEAADNPFLFYLEEGENTIKLEVALGEFANMIAVTNSVLYELSTIYRQIIMITSRNPDPMRTYQLENKIPLLVERLQEQSRTLRKLAIDLEDYTGEKGDHISLLNSFAHQLDLLAERPDDRIPRSLGELRDNLASLGSWILMTTEQPLQVDYLVIASPEKEMPVASPSVWQILVHEVKSFIASFTHDYNQIGNVYDEGRSIKVWIGGGRDQAQTLKTMIEDSFTPVTGIQVNLELIQEGVILPATLAGKGPDVALSVSPALPINFFIRNAIVDLTEFEDFPEVAARFKQSALVPFKYRDSVFALPEQQVFPVLFYRIDILQEMGIKLPETWDDVIYVIAELQKNNMDFGLPYSNIEQIAVGGIGEATSGAGSIVAHAGVSTMLMLLYQSGGELYKVDGIETNLDSEVAIDAFTRWTELYELYNLPLYYDYANYFRMGEMPLLLTGYTFRNHLEVFAPELRGKWGFTLVPGTVQEDGSLNRTTPALGYGTANQGPGVIIMKNARDKEAAWEFLKWWTSAETQVRFGRELESIMGTAARYPTANIEALQLLPWRVEELEVLLEQWEWVKGLPEVP
ncbi:MAG: extracellular solute-binding protein, partial [Halanaerobiaceae bacterium]|nr:extracellular solute-binding protein [Halanaerobiaceae bacterium]